MLVFEYSDYADLYSIYNLVQVGANSYSVIIMDTPDVPIFRHNTKIQ